MSGPISNEVAEAPVEAPVEAEVPNTVEEVVDTVPDAADEPVEQMSFMDAIDAAFTQKVEQPTQQEPVAEPVAEVEVEPEIVPIEEILGEDFNQEETIEESETVENDPTDVLSEDIGDEWTPKAASRFKQLKSELKQTSTELHQLRQQREEYEQKIQELSGIAESKDVEVLQQKLEEYERIQMFSNLEETEAFQKAVAEPLQKIVSDAADIAEKYEVDPDALIDAMSFSDNEEQDQKLNDLLGGASDRDKAKIYHLINQIDPLLEMRQNMFDNADEALKEAELLEERKAQAAAADNLRVRKEVAQNVAERVQQKLPFLAGIEDLDMEAIKTKAYETDPSVMHPVQFTFNSISAQLLPTVVREFVAMRAENAELTNRLAAYEDAEPSMSGNSPTSGQVAGGASSSASFEDAVNAAFGAGNLNR